MLKWIKSYLTDQKQSISVRYLTGSATSEPKVSQGRVLLPVPFIAYTDPWGTYYHNAAVCIVCHLGQFDPFTDILVNLHWLPIGHRIIFKTLLSTFKSINGLAPEYLSELLVKYDHVYSLWNNLPYKIQSLDDVDNFKTHVHDKN